LRAVSDVDHMIRAVTVAATLRRVTSPNPWVGAVLVTCSDGSFEGATEAPGGRHAEIVALDAARAAGADTRDAELFVTLEPCAHHGRTGPCVDAIINAGVGRVVVGVVDPDRNVAGRGVERLQAADIDVTIGVEAEAVEAQLAPYLTHRRTGRPWVILKLASTLDGRTAAPDGSSQWITGPEARADAHALRAESDAVLVGAGTVRRDDPLLTVRHGVDGRQPIRVVLGKAAPSARVHPCVELSGALPDILDELGRRDVVQLLVEGGASVAADFHRAGLVDHYVLYFAPAFFGGDDARGLFTGAGAATMANLWRGRIVSAVRLGDDLRVDLVAALGTAASPLGG
jgi:diaminohydroxyphosphoribosylaminopyrimidine deaminase/5-amino-6-(5-phosphoribosylamino)uracil reductase